MTVQHRHPESRLKFSTVHLASAESQILYRLYRFAVTPHSLRLRVTLAGHFDLTVLPRDVE
jgi:hypothetical protein